MDAVRWRHNNSANASIIFMSNPAPLTLCSPTERIRVDRVQLINEIALEETKKRGVAFLDLFPVTLSLVHPLHDPSAVTPANLAFSAGRLRRDNLHYHARSQRFGSSGMLAGHLLSQLWLHAFCKRTVKPNMR